MNRIKKQIATPLGTTDCLLTIASDTSLPPTDAGAAPAALRTCSDQFVEVMRQEGVPGKLIGYFSKTIKYLAIDDIAFKVIDRAADPVNGAGFEMSLRGRKPAPVGGRKMDVSQFGVADFTSPSGRIWCELSRDQALCMFPPDMDTRALPRDATAFCRADISIAAAHVTTTAGLTCSGGLLSVPGIGGDSTRWFASSGFPRGPVGAYGRGQEAAAALPYGATLAFGDRYCTSTTTGMTCANSATGAQFTVSLSGPVFSGPTDRIG